MADFTREELIAKVKTYNENKEYDEENSDDPPFLNLKNCDLSNLNLSRIELKNVNLDGANLSNTDLIASELTAVFLNRANLSNTNLTGAKLKSVSMKRANLSNANFSAASSGYSDYMNANLSKANFTGATFYLCFFINANLRGATLDGSLMTIIGFEGADLRDTKITGNLSGRLNFYDLNTKFSDGFDPAIYVRRKDRFPFLSIRETDFPAQKPRRRIPLKVRDQVFRDADYRCQQCGKSVVDGVKLEVDHIMPVSKGGSDDISNLQLLCFDCNRGKSNTVA